MAVVVNNDKQTEETKESIEAKKKLQDLLEIKDLNNDIMYTASIEEYEEVLDDILSSGEYVKTFELLKGRIKLTFKTITEKEQQDGYTFIRQHFVANEKLSPIERDTFTSKVNIAQQLIRIETGGIATPISNGNLKERLQMLDEQPGDLLRLISKYLTIFANITARAFNCEDALKN